MQVLLSECNFFLPLLQWCRLGDKLRKNVGRSMSLAFSIVPAPENDHEADNSHHASETVRPPSDQGEDCPYECENEDEPASTNELQGDEERGRCRKPHDWTALCHKDTERVNRSPIRYCGLWNRRGSSIVMVHIVVVYQ